MWIWNWTFLFVRGINLKMKKNIIVIGGSGFVGSRLILDYKNLSFINFDKNQSPFFPSITTIGNICNKSDLIFEKNVDTVVLLAAEHKDNVSPKSLYYDVNVKGTKNVLDAMDKAGISNLIFTSSVAVYGLNKKNPDENHPFDPFNDYGKSKLEAEFLIKEWYENDPKNKSITIIRPTVIFGERNRGNVYNLLKQIYSKKFVMIGKGLNKKSMAYVGNVSSFIYNRISNRELGLNIYNYVDKPDLTMNDLLSVIEKKLNFKLLKISLPIWLGIYLGYFIDLIAFILNKKFSISSVRIKKFCATTQFDSKKAMNVFKPPYTIKEGLNKTLDYEFLNSKKDDILFYSE